MPADCPEPRPGSGVRDRDRTTILDAGGGLKVPPRPRWMRWESSQAPRKRSRRNQLREEHTSYADAVPRRQSPYWSTRTTFDEPEEQRKRLELPRFQDAGARDSEARITRPADAEADSQIEAPPAISLATICRSEQKRRQGRDVQLREERRCQFDVRDCVERT